ncbi:OpgC family protein [Pseudogemmobacter faecipullorum]
MSQDTGTVRRRERDLRLDFFRGLAMIVILIAHIPDNPWWLWLPGRFGFSDSTEIFVFCSGMASALAYGVIFHRAGWLIGTGRVLYRIWQIYWVHLGTFFAVLLSVILMNMTGLFGRDQIGQWNLYPLLVNTAPNLIGLLSLTYVPNFFDILPMYMVLLALLPLMMATAKISPWLSLSLSLALWGLGTGGAIGLPAEWWFASGSTRSWFFNPFAWQLIFFIGFGLVAGWLPVPPRHPVLIGLASAILLASLPFSWSVIFSKVSFFGETRGQWAAWFDKSGFGAIRAVHFLALAYLAYTACGKEGENLKALSRALPRITAFVTDIGKQALAAYAASTVLSPFLGAVLNEIGRNWFNTACVNLAGLLLVWLASRLVGWCKGSSWKNHLNGPAQPPIALAVSAEKSAAVPLAPARRRSA